MLGLRLADWVIMNVAPEWVVVGSVVTSLLCMAGLLALLAYATREPKEPARYTGSRRAGRPAQAQPWSSRPGEHSRLRTAPYVTGRHRVHEWSGGREQPWPGRLR